jgi:hypothetical protein
MFFVANKVILVVLNGVQRDIGSSWRLLVVGFDFGHLQLSGSCAVNAMHILLVVCIGANTTSPV